MTEGEEDWAGTLLWRHRPGFAPLNAASVPPGLAAGPGLSLHHDGVPATVSARREADGSLRLGTEDFAGSYLSLALALPEETGEPPGRASVLGLALALDEAAMPAVRLNLRSGVNLERPGPAVVTRAGGLFVAEFDLSDLPPDPVSGGWFDLLFPGGPGLDLRIGPPALYHRLLAGF